MKQMNGSDIKEQHTIEKTPKGRLSLEMNKSKSSVIASAQKKKKGSIVSQNDPAARNTAEDSSYCF
jgi:hypothetical protein